MSSPRSADPSANDGLIAALDIGGTKIAGALVDRDGVLVHRARRTTPARESTYFSVRFTKYSARWPSAHCGNKFRQWAWEAPARSIWHTGP
ncbi:hypothetical protein SMICM304S_11215 [Streptomyces microflavus]